MKKLYQKIASLLVIVMLFMNLSPTLMLAAESTAGASPQTTVSDSSDTTAKLSSSCQLTAKDG
ncbi:MAG: hypothetical protein PHN26_08975, partial [Eubacteriaceae bacterium]|nr:hypothetical protein [Eubacteriaceae bacterium]